MTKMHKLKTEGSLELQRVKVFLLWIRENLFNPPFPVFPMRFNSKMLSFKVICYAATVTRTHCDIIIEN